MECGSFDDHALRATFGLEFQIFRCSKVVVSLAGSYNDDGRKWFYKIDLAPLYDSIQRIENGKPMGYGCNPNNNPSNNSISNDCAPNGQIAYLDWYKNLGTRSYYLGDVPLIDSYIERRGQKNYFRMGRQRNFIAFSEDQTPWQDDGKFAPYADWLVRDLYTGLVYGFDGNLLQINLGFFSGNNPIKGGGYYLNGAISPNVKGNNTGIYAGKLGLHHRDGINDFQIYVGTELNVLGSTWSNELEDGKRNNHRRVRAIRYARKFWHREIMFLAQHTQYVTGLKAGSAQASDPTAEKPERFQDIIQEGSFVGIYYQGKKFDYGYVYEEIDRFDSKIFVQDNFAFLRERLPQKSNIYYGRINFTDYYGVQLAYHAIKNHAPEVSEIVTRYNGDPIDYETRFKIVHQIKF